MAITENQYTGNGSTVLYSFTFPYLEVADIKVSLDGTLTTEYTLANATTVQFNTAPANGVAILIFRQTNDEVLSAQFFPGSAIRAQDLNDNFTQTLYVSQESYRDAGAATEIAELALTTSNTALTNSNTAISTANTALSTANTAAANAAAAVITANAADAKANTAIATANSADAKADAAVITANTANAKADAAISTANAAETKATTAINTANSAASTANAAVSTANSATSTANTALGAAETAEENSIIAVDTANDAKESAELAVVIADSVKTSGVSFSTYYNEDTPGTPGSKVMDLGDLDTSSFNDYFPGESNGIRAYTCARGTSIISLGTLS